MRVEVRVHLTNGGKTIELNDVPVSGLRCEGGKPETQRERNAVEPLPLSVGREGLVEGPGLIVLIHAASEEVELVLPPACSGVLTCHDHMDIGVLLIPDPRHPGDLRTVVAVVALAPTAVEEYARYRGRRSGRQILRLQRGRRKREARNQNGQREE